MKKLLLIGIMALLLALPIASAEIYTEVECKERNWFWWDYTCHENEVQESFNEVTDYINANEVEWLKDTTGISFNSVLDYLETTFWTKINELIDNKLDEREARINLGWEVGEETINLEKSRIKAMRTKEFINYEDYVCSPEGFCLRTAV